MARKPTVSIGVFAHNEAKNIGFLLKRLGECHQEWVRITEIIVVSTASTDGTDDIVQGFAKSTKRWVRLVKEEKRTGKAASVNNFLRVRDPKADLCVVMSADIIPAKGALDALCSVFERDSEIGMAGGRPVPVNRRDRLISYVVHFMWELHHQVSLRRPKCGEMVAFRNVVAQIPPISIVDEASIEAEIRKKGYRLEYVPQSIVYNKGPESASDFLKRRRAIHAGHQWLARDFDHTVSTANKRLLLCLAFKEFVTNRGVKWKAGIIYAICLELLGEILGYYDFHREKREHGIWEVAETTKDLRLMEDE